MKENNLNQFDGDGEDLEREKKEFREGDHTDEEVF